MNNIYTLQSTRYNKDGVILRSDTIYASTNVEVCKKQLEHTLVDLRGKKIKKYTDHITIEFVDFIIELSIYEYKMVDGVNLGYVIE